MAGAQPEQPLQSLPRRSSTCCRALTDRVVDGTPTLDGFDVAVHRGEVRAHRHDRYVAPPCIAPRRDIARPLVVPATGCPVVCDFAETSQPDRDLPFRARQYPGSVDPVVGVLMVDHRLFPQITDQGNLLLLPLGAPPKVSGHLETVEFHPVPADPDAQAKPAI